MGGVPLHILPGFVRVLAFTVMHRPFTLGNLLHILALSGKAGTDRSRYWSGWKVFALVLVGARLWISVMAIPALKSATISFEAGSQADFGGPLLLKISLYY
jgi:hypothetical protein